MKKIFVVIVALCFAVSASAQSIARTGFYMQDSNPVLPTLQNEFSVTVVVQTVQFTPGEFARYAQKLLGVRAPLTERVETKILSATLSEGRIDTKGEITPMPVAEQTCLPDYRVDNRAMTVEQQAEAAANLIFAMRRHRKELITGEAGENVFGAGLASALAQMDAMEQQCLDMFYGKSQTKIETFRYTVTPTADQTNYILARYREGVGVVTVDELSGMPIMAVVTPKAVDTSALPIATEKDKVKSKFAVAAQCNVELLCGTDTMDTLDMEMFQYGTQVVLAVK